MNVPRNTPPPGHVLAPAAAIGSLAAILALGLALLGLADRMDAVIAGWLGGGVFPERVPPWVVWLGGGVVSYGLSLAILSVPGVWRRVVLWITALVVMAAWAPVLVLSARDPAISTGIIPVLWSGICSLVYAQRHRMEADEIVKIPSHGAR